MHWGQPPGLPSQKRLRVWVKATPRGGSVSRPIVAEAPTSIAGQFAQVLNRFRKTWPVVTRFVKFVIRQSSHTLAMFAFKGSDTPPPIRNADASLPGLPSQKRPRVWVKGPFGTVRLRCVLIVRHG